MRRNSPLLTGEKEMMPLGFIVLVVIVVGLALWLINTYVPMAGIIKRTLNAVVVISVCVWVLKAIGLWAKFVNSQVPR